MNNIVTEKPKNVLFDNCKKLIELLVKPENKINWGAEIKIAKWLLDGYPDMVFWSNLNLNYKLNSLAFLVSDRGRAEIRAHWTRFKLASGPNIVYPLEKENVIQIEPSKHKAKDIIEFLDGV